MGRILAAEVKSVIPAAKNLKDQAIKVKKEVVTLERRLFSEEELAKAEAFLKECEGKKIEYTEFNPQSDFMRFHYAHRAFVYIQDKSKTRDITLMTIKIGDFLLYAFPGEIFVQFGQHIKANAPTDKRMVVELAFESVGYLPTKDMFQPTVYESTLPTCIFIPEGGHIMADKLVEIGKEIF